MREQKEEREFDLLNGAFEKVRIIKLSRSRQLRFRIILNRYISAYDEGAVLTPQIAKTRGRRGPRRVKEEMGQR